MCAGSTAIRLQLPLLHPATTAKVCLSGTGPVWGYSSVAADSMGNEMHYASWAAEVTAIAVFAQGNAVHPAMCGGLEWERGTTPRCQENFFWCLA